MPGELELELDFGSVGQAGPGGAYRHSHHSHHSFLADILPVWFFQEHATNCCTFPTAVLH